MPTKPCKKCGAEIEFQLGITTAVGSQPFRSHAFCPACGTKHYLMVESGLHDAYEDDESPEP